jgi:hypothetical protein
MGCLTGRVCATRNLVRLDGVPSFTRRAATFFLAVWSAVALVATGCGSEGRTIPAPRSETVKEGRVVKNADAAMTFQLVASTLVITLDDDASKATRRMLANTPYIFCGTRAEFGPFRPSARAIKQVVSTSGDELTATLSTDIEAEVAFCGVEARNGSAEAFGFFVPPEELLGG